MQKIITNKFSVMIGFPSYIDRDSMDIPIFLVFFQFELEKWSEFADISLGKYAKYKANRKKSFVNALISKHS